jgi:hypothetical protein
LVFGSPRFLVLPGLVGIPSIPTQEASAQEDERWGVLQFTILIRLFAPFGLIYLERAGIERLYYRITLN